MSGLAPCPFCGCDEIIEDWGSAMDTSKGCIQTGWLECRDCKTSVEFEVNESNMDWTLGGTKLRQKWNTRTDDTLTERVNQLTEQNLAHASACQGYTKKVHELTERVKELEGAIEEVGQYILSIKTNAHNVDVETVSGETREAFAIIAKVLNKE